MKILVLVTWAITSLLIHGQTIDPYIVLNDTAGGTFAIETSPSQVSEASTTLLVMIPGSELDTTASSIADRYTCSDYKFEFEVPDAVAKPFEISVNVSLPGSVGPGDSAVCTADWGDTLTDDITVDGALVTQLHEYAEGGVYVVKFDCTSDVGAAMCPGNNEECVAINEFFDTAFKTFLTPIKFFTTDAITIKSYMALNPLCGSNSPVITWRFTRLNISEYTDFSTFIQPQTSVLMLPPETLEPAEYVVHLEIAFPSRSNQHWSSDWFIMRVLLPELVAYIAGGDEIYASFGDTIIVNATSSLDPVSLLTSVVAEPLIASWSFAKSGMTAAKRRSFLKKFPDTTLSSATNTIYQFIQNGTDYLLQIDTSLFPKDKWYLVMFTLSRGSRQSSTVQAIYVTDNPLPLTIECIYNCDMGRERKWKQDKIELDAVLDETKVDLSQVTYAWRIEVWTTILFFSSYKSVLRAAAKTESGLDTRSIAVKKGSLTSTKSIRIEVTVTAPGYTDTSASMIRTINTLPYAGTCATTNTTGQAARDWFTFECTGWKGLDDRLEKKASLDTNPILSFTVMQWTADAVVEDEPILQTRSLKSHVILKLGDPNNGYSTTLTVRVMDMYQNYQIVYLTMQATPAFLWDSVTPTETGSNLVRQYTTTDYITDENQLRAMGKVDMIIPLISSVCSHVHHIQLPVWQPPVPRKLNSGGEILDLSSTGNKDVGDLDKVVTDANNVTIDPATLTIQEVLENMTLVINAMVEQHVTNGSRANDKALMSMFTNVFTNLAARAQYVNINTKIYLIVLGEVIGVAALDTPENSTNVNAAQLEESAGEIYHMAQAVVNAAVPDNLREARRVTDNLGGWDMIGAMISVAGNINTWDTKMSPAERAYLYVNMQSVVKYELEQKHNVTRTAARMAKKLARDVQEKLKVCKTCSNQGSNLTDQLVLKNDRDMVKNQSYPTKTSKFTLTGLEDVVKGSTESVSVSAFEFTENVFMYDDDQTSSLVTSNILQIDVKTTEKRVTPGYMTFDQTIVTPSPQRIEPHVDDEDASDFSYHQFVYQTNTDQVCVIIRPMDEVKVQAYTVYVKFTAAPSLLDYNFYFDVTKDMSWQKCVLPFHMQGHIGLTFLAIRLSTVDEKTVHYDFTLITVGCLAWEEDAQKWHTDKCEQEWIPTENTLRCFCKDLTELTFGNSFFVAPNSIDFSSVFLKFSPLNQAAVLGTIGGLFVLYILALLWAAGRDRKDVLKWGITPLRDNRFGDSQYYIIKVFTGMRPGAGTRSRVGFSLLGGKGDTGVREMSDGVREEFSTGSILSFFMATRKHLGELVNLTIWHDNSGSGEHSAWYLNQVIVYDVDKNQTYTFVVERWLSVETHVLASISSNTVGTPLQFESRFFHQTRSRLSESHMWASVLYRPQLSSFTRVQRVSCVLAYILLTMIANAMYFNPDDNYQSVPFLQIGPFRMSARQLYISVICALVATPATMLIIVLFKRTKRKPYDVSHEQRTCCPCYMCCKRSCRSARRERQEKYEEKLRSKLLSSGVPEFHGFYLHYRFLYLAWFLVFCAVFVSAFFIILYSMEWGKQKSEEWLTTFLMSLLESLLLVDPIMVVCLSLVFACVIRSNKEDVNVDMVMVVKNYRRMNGESEVDCRVPPPLEGADLEKAAEETKKRQLMTTSLRDIVLNVFLMLIIFTICYSNRDDRSYRHHEDIVNQIVTPWKLPYFKKIKTPGDVFAWMNQSVLPSIFPELDINGSPLHWTTRRYTTGYYNFRLGPPRIRQVRTSQPDSCVLPYIGRMQCYDTYSIPSEDTGHYCLQWASQPCHRTQSVYSISSPAWEFVSAVDVWGFPILGTYTTYGGGGYIASLDVNRDISKQTLQELYNNTWLDRQTRAVMVEFTVYCASTNLFIYHEFLVEFPETGGAFTSYSIYPIRIYTHTGASGTVTLVCEVIFAIYMVFLLCKLCHRFYKQRRQFFTKFWQVFEFAMLLLGLAAIVMYAIRLVTAYSTIQLYKADMRKFANFKHIVVWDQILVSLLAVLVFMATLRILEVFTSSKKIDGIVKVFTNCGIDLVWYGLTFLYIFIAFCVMGWIIFGAHLYSFQNIYRTMVTLFLSLIGKSNYTEISLVNEFYSIVFFLLYVISVLFFVMTIFLSILGASIDDVTKENKADEREDLIEYMLTQFKTLIVKPSSGKAGAFPTNKTSPESAASVSQISHRMASGPSSCNQRFQTSRLTQQEYSTPNNVTSTDKPSLTADTTSPAKSNSGSTSGPVDTSVRL